MNLFVTNNLIFSSIKTEFERFYSLDRLPVLHISRYSPHLIVYPEIKS